MLEVVFTVDETGAQFVVDATGHDNVMQLAVENDVPNIEGECGGEMTCGTCHVYVEAGRWNQLPPIDEYEEEMLAELENREHNSRLSCQLVHEPTMADLTLTVAPRG